MAGCHHFLIDSVKNLWCKESEIVFDRIEGIHRLIKPTTVTEHFADRFVLVGQFVDPVVVNIKSKPDYPEHKNFPLFHARSSCLNTDHRPIVAWSNFLQNLEYSLPELRACVNVL